MNAYFQTRGRTTLRMRGYDYQTPGYYAVTIDTYRQEHLFGAVVDGVMRLNRYGEVVNEKWLQLPRHFPSVRTHLLQIMPNHIHFVLRILPCGSGRRVVQCTRRTEVAMSTMPKGTTPGSLNAVVQNFQSTSARKINRLRGTTGASVWHRDYWDVIIQDDRHLATIEQYILENPQRWWLRNRNKRDCT